MVLVAASSGRRDQAHGRGWAFEFSSNFEVLLITITLIYSEYVFS